MVAAAAAACERKREEVLIIQAKSASERGRRRTDQFDRERVRERAVCPKSTAHLRVSVSTRPAIE